LGHGQQVSYCEKYRSSGHLYLFSKGQSPLDNVHRIRVIRLLDERIRTGSFVDLLPRFL